MECEESGDSKNKKKLRSVIIPNESWKWELLELQED